MKGDGACMKTQHTSPVHRLEKDQLAMLVTIVIEESGDKLSRAQFNSTVSLLFENIAGVERLSCKQAGRYLRTLWRMYRSTLDRV